MHKTALITGVTGQDGTYLSEFLVDPKYFRPAEVDILLGDASKARIILGWIPEYGISQLVKEMMRFKLYAEGTVFKIYGFNTLNYYE